NRNAVARPRFTCSNPNIFRIFWGERDRADRLHRLFVEHGPVSRPAIIGFPDTATGGGDEERNLARRLACSSNCWDTPAHRWGSDVAGAETGDGRRVEWRFLSTRRNCAEK